MDLLACHQRQRTCRPAISTAAGLLTMLNRLERLAAEGVLLKLERRREQRLEQRLA